MNPQPATTHTAPAEQPKTEPILWLRVGQLRFHPNNMYAVGPSAESHEMADSIRERGILQPLRVTPAEDDGYYIVEDGNLRLQGLHELKDMQRQVPCRLSDARGLDTGLNMAAANLVRRDRDPVAEARHFKAMMDAGGLSQQALARRIGVYQAKISSVMHLLDVDPEIQALVSARKLVKDARVHRALRSIEDRQARIGLAERLADSGASITECLKAVETYLTVAANQARVHPGRGRPRKDGLPKASDRMTVTPSSLGPYPALELAAAANELPDLTTTLPVSDLRASAAAMCKACDLGEHAGQFGREPAWSLVVHAAQKTCADCNLPKLREVCAACPGVALIAELARATGYSGAAAKATK